MKRAVVLLSGGLDSTATLFYALKKKYKVFGLAFDYGQRHKKEIYQARKIAQYAKISLKVVKVHLPWKGSSLLDKGIQLPKNRKVNITPKGIPSTYVPSRNIIFLSFAASYAEAIGAQAIFIGANAIDYSGYPDCRPEFYQAYQKALSKGTKAGVQERSIKIYTPLIKKTKAHIVRLAQILKVPFRLTWSCYQGGRRPCGVCDSCLLRKKGFDESKIKDPLS